MYSPAPQILYNHFRAYLVGEQSGFRALGLYINTPYRWGIRFFPHTMYPLPYEQNGDTPYLAIPVFDLGVLLTAVWQLGGAYVLYYLSRRTYEAYLCKARIAWRAYLISFCCILTFEAYALIQVIFVFTHYTICSKSTEGEGSGEMFKCSQRDFKFFVTAEHLLVARQVIEIVLLFWNDLFVLSQAKLLFPKRQWFMKVMLLLVVHILGSCVIYEDIDISALYLFFTLFAVGSITLRLRLRHRYAKKMFKSIAAGEPQKHNLPTVVNAILQSSWALAYYGQVILYALYVYLATKEVTTPFNFKRNLPVIQHLFYTLLAVYPALSYISTHMQVSSADFISKDEVAAFKREALESQKKDEEPLILLQDEEVQKEEVVKKIENMV